jgi:hypothetical protein
LMIGAARYLARKSIIEAAASMNNARRDRSIRYEPVASKTFSHNDGTDRSGDRVRRPHAANDVPRDTHACVVRNDTPLIGERAQRAGASQRKVPMRAAVRRGIHAKVRSIIAQPGPLLQLSAARFSGTFFTDIL